MDLSRSGDSSHGIETTKSPWSDPILNRLILSAQFTSPKKSGPIIQMFLAIIRQIADIGWYRVISSSSDDELGTKTTNIDFIFSQKSGYRKIAKDPSILLDSEKVKFTFWRSIVFTDPDSIQAHHAILFVKNLSSITTLQELEQYFTQFGKILKIHRFKRSDGKSTRFALIIFKDSASAHKCLQTNHPKINNFKVKVRPFSGKQTEIEESLEKIQASLNNESLKLAESLSDEKLKIMLEGIRTSYDKLNVYESLQAVNKNEEVHPLCESIKIGFAKTSDSGSPFLGPNVLGPTLNPKTNRYVPHLAQPIQPIEVRLRTLDHQEVDAHQMMHHFQFHIPIKVLFYAFPNETYSTDY